MPKQQKVNKPTKPNAGKRGDNGQANNQRAIADLNRKVDLLESRTVSSRTNAADTNKFAAAVNVNPLKTKGAKPKHDEYLLPHETKYHNWLKGDSDAEVNLLPNFNIEPSEVKQHWRGNYRIQVTVAAGTGKTMFVNSARGTTTDWGGSLGESPKAFASSQLMSCGGAAVPGIPGPCKSTSGVVAAAVTMGTLTSPVGVLTDNGQSSSPSGYVSVYQSQPECPFECVIGSGAALRWQLGRIRVKSENITLGASRGGTATLLQPRNNINDVANNSDISVFMSRGIFRSFTDMQIRGEHGEWASLDVRPGLQAFHAPTSSTGYTQYHAAAMVHLSNPTVNDQIVVVYLTLDWELSGAAVRGIGKAHIHCPLAADHAREVSEAMRAAGVIPSDQGPKQSIANGMKLANDRALQLATHGAGAGAASSALKTAAAVIGHPTVKKMAAAGFAAAKNLVAGLSAGAA